MLKRAFDLIMAIIMLVALFPILLITAIFVWITMGWPVIYSHKRPGYKSRIFTLYKFRTMKNAFDKDGEPLPDEKRLTRCGKILRSTSIDELPELVNVIKGEMSLVGPRPLLVKYLDIYTPDQARRHEVRPGITGWAQINGRNAISWAEKFDLDIWYVNNRSFVLDIKILFLTLKKVVKRDGITADNHVTMSEFTREDNLPEKSYE